MKFFQKLNHEASEYARHVNNVEIYTYCVLLKDSVGFMKKKQTSTSLLYNEQFIADC